MRITRCLTVALLVNFVAWSPAAAGPITDPASLNLGGPADSPLFDDSGMAILLITAPNYLQFNANTGSDDGGGNGGGGDNAFVDAGINGFSAAAFGGGSDNTAAGDGAGGATIPDGSSGDGDNDPSNGGSNNPTGLLDLSPNRSVPEPATLLLLGSGLIAASRRRART